MSVLGADEPTPAEVLRAEGGARFLLTADHAGWMIPRVLGDLGVCERTGA